MFSCHLPLRLNIFPRAINGVQPYLLLGAHHAPTETTEVTRIDSDSHRCAAFNGRLNQYYLYITCAPYIALLPRTVNAIPLDPLSWL